MVMQAVAKVNSKSTVWTDTQLNALYANAANQASEILYSLSGRQFTGECGPVTIRPVARPIDADNRGSVSRGAWNYGGWGTGSQSHFGMPAVLSSYGQNEPPVIEIFDYPVNKIVEVKIDGVVIPPDEYELRDQKHLVRMRPTAESDPTDRWGWPTSQVQDLPDTQEGTFSITYTYGQDPGYAGRLACTVFAAYLLIPQLGDTSAYPQRVVNINRQGVAMQIASPIDILNKGMTGIEEVDAWILAVNPNKMRRQSVAFTPDRPPNRRQQYPTTS